MKTSQQLDHDIAEFRLHFDAIYLAGIPRLLDEQGMFLSFLLFLTATDTLAGAFSDEPGTGSRFRAFVERFHSTGLRDRSCDLWKARNLMVHAFNPGPFGLVAGQSRLHLTTAGEVTVLNAQDMYAALDVSSRAYFDALQLEPALQVRFEKRLAESDGGGIQAHIVSEARTTLI